MPERITIEDLASDKGLPARWLRDQVGLHDLPRGGVGIPYWDAAGELIATKKRTALAARDGSFWPRQGLQAYGQWRLDQAAQAGFCLLVEGESDCWAAWYHGVPCLGIPGANACATLRHEHTEAVERWYLVREPDQGGDRFGPGIATRLARLRHWGRAHEISRLGCKDLADLHMATRGQPGLFERRLEAAILESQQIYPHKTSLEELIALLRQGRVQLAPILLDILRDELPSLLLDATEAKYAHHP